MVVIFDKPVGRKRTLGALELGDGRWEFESPFSHLNSNYPLEPFPRLGLLWSGLS